jgi:hypothetical protein
VIVQHGKTSPKIIFFWGNVHRRFIALPFSVKTLWREQVVLKCYGSLKRMKINQRTSFGSRMGLPLIFVETFVAGPHRWMGRGDLGDLIFCPWPVRSSNPTPCEGQSVCAIATCEHTWFAEQDCCTCGDHHTRHAVKVWQELDYHLDVCRVTKGANGEHL